MLSFLYDTSQREDMISSRVSLPESSLTRSIETMGLRILTDNVLQYRPKDLRKGVTDHESAIVSYIHFITSFVDREEEVSGPRGGKSGRDSMVEGVSKEGGDDGSNGFEKVDCKVFMIPGFMGLEITNGLKDVIRVKQLTMRRSRGVWQRWLMNCI